MKPPIIHTPIKYSKDTKGYTIHCTATINGDKKYLRKVLRKMILKIGINYFKMVLTQQMKLKKDNFTTLQQI